MTRPATLVQRAATKPAVTIKPARPGTAEKSAGVPAGDRTPRVPGGAAAPPGMATESVDPLTSRTVTVDDPLTTSLLAEISRRPTTVDVSPEQIDEVHDLAAGERDPDDPP